MLARNNAENQSIIVEYGGLIPLLRNIQPGSGYPQELLEQTVHALAQIGRNHPANQSNIGGTNAISSLVDLLRRSNSPRIETEVSGALWVLADKHSQNKGIFLKHAMK